MEDPINETLDDLQQQRAALFDTASNTLVNTPPATRQIDSPDVEPIPRFGDLFPGQMIRLVLWYQERPIPIQFEDELVIGRAHFRTGYKPDVDLTPFGGSLKGVSRRHVRLVRNGDILYVEDLNSTNGTWLNGRPLTGGKRVLRNGDYLNLGHFEMRIEFAQT